jgi:ElaB/YqjD/DUF883 family membrane-anchored ribosome-binding protein
MSLPNDPPLYGGVAPAPGVHPAGPPPLGNQGGYDAQREAPSTTGVAKDQAADVAGTARDAGKHVAGVAGEQAGQVASEATHQVKQLVHQAKGELTEQAATQQQRVASGLRSLSKELGTMAQGSEQSGMATDLVHQASERTNAVASWLEQREPGHVLDEVTRFARQRPGTFLALAAGAGLLVGRLGRGLKAATDDANDQASEPIGQGYAPTPTPYPPTSGYGYDPVSGYPPPSPTAGYPQQSPVHPQPQAPGYQGPPTYSPPPAPGYPQGPAGRDLTP